MAKKPKDDKVEIWLYRDGNRLAPVAEMDFDVIASLKPGYKVICTMTPVPQDPGTRRFYEALIGKVAKATGRTVRSIKLEIMRELKLFEGAEVLADGSVYFQPVKTGEMSHDEFYHFVEAAKLVICEVIVPGATIDEIMAGVHTYAGLAEVDL